ncbi:hypothetical protein H2201_003182 [Coniosporium apollinis]|uniref:Phosphoglycerate mutase n=1 Tax=Coniosporium apollinis TaxID=61459 RepID=A0ABQ9NXV6_9PEZI|nr:hypothetical protein H2201_003182 [Coniosporium apollinis]
MPDKDAGTPRVFLFRHGITEWTINGRYTGTTELSLTEAGEKQVIGSGRIIVGPGKLIDPTKLAHVFVSPRVRAKQTFELAFEEGDRKELEKEGKVSETQGLAEWNYGLYEGLVTKEIRALRKEHGLDGEREWDIWRDGCEGGESPEQVTARLDALISEIHEIQGPNMHGEKACDVVLVAHGHILRAFVKRWLKYPMEFPLSMMLEPGGVGVLSYQHHNVEEPAILALAAPQPQDIDIEAVEAAPDPVMITPAVAIPSQAATGAAAVVEAAAAIEVSLLKRTDMVCGGEEDPSACIEVETKRDVHVVKRDGDCSKQPVGSGPVPSPDTAAAFISNQDIQDLARSAPTPDGYSLVLSNLDGSLSASVYLGLTTLESYDTLGCQSLYDRTTGCVAFNVYVERDPTLDTNAEKCPNPSSTTNFKCTLWGAPVSAEQATNKGEWRNQFQVVIAASNAYNKAAPPPVLGGFNGPFQLGGAINAPYAADGHNTFMGSRYFPFFQDQGYTPSTCAEACVEQTAYNKRHPRSDGTYQTCAFFNSYVLSKNGVPQSLSCSLYDQSWDASYGKNYGQHRGNDKYTVSQSYSYAVAVDADYVSSARSIIQASTLQPFCSSLLSYTTPMTTVETTVTALNVKTQTTVVTQTRTSTTTVLGYHRRSAGLATPAALTDFAASILTSTCSAQATPVTETSTHLITASTTVETTTLVTSTTIQTAVATAVTDCGAVVSGCRFGSVIPIIRTNIRTLQQCGNLCRKDARCTFFMYSRFFQDFLILSTALGGSRVAGTGCLYDWFPRSC